jgi:hypothetical protein
MAKGRGAELAGRSQDRGHGQRSAGQTGAQDVGNFREARKDNRKPTRVRQGLFEDCLSFLMCMSCSLLPSPARLSFN